jgi:1,4-alpha-glucan branching enzyme
MNKADIEAIAAGTHADPFAILGPHPAAEGIAIRTFQPGADTVTVIESATGNAIAALEKLHPAGFFAGTVPAQFPYRLRIGIAGGSYETEDPYAFSILLGGIDIHLLTEGKHHDFSRAMGSHPCVIDGIAGVRFAVWAPNARRVSVVGQFNGWDGRRHVMRLRIGAGIWEIFIPRLCEGDIYKYEIMAADGVILPLKADPVAWRAEGPPGTASIIASTSPRQWRDAAWMQSRAARQSAQAPIAIYEVHAPSWRHDGGRNATWRFLSATLIPYVVELGFTHIELLPVMTHPFGGSWGYQPLGQFAPDAPLGTPEEFAEFVEACHLAGLGVILDWVPAHFPADTHGLAQFDGTALYEYADPREGYHQDWNTLIYNLARNEVRGFLTGSALHWLEHFHVDGLRVDAVASMLYRDYSRKAGEWLPNIHGGRENLESIAFLQQLSYVAAARAAGAILIAEESTDWPKVTAPPGEGGLGFDFKWNMGWMNDTLRYMQQDPVHRKWHHDRVTFGMMYAYSERFVLPLSHDEVVHLKRSLLSKMPGDDWQRFANLRAYFGFMWTHPGKKLLFMGGEFGQWHEWNNNASLDWHLLEVPSHRGVQNLVRDLNHLYREMPALHGTDADPAGFAWVVVEDKAQSVFAYLRFGHEGDKPALVVFNATPMPRHGYRIGVPFAGVWREVLNTDSSVYGGANLGNGGAVAGETEPSHFQPASLVLTLPPLATLVLSPA